MSTVTREALCRVALCPEPTSPDWHACIVCENPVIEHAHVQARSQRPDLKRSRNNIVALCHAHHQLQSEHKWEFHVQALPFDGLEHQWLTDERGNVRWRRDVELDGSAGSQVAVQPDAMSRVPASSDGGEGTRQARGEASIGAE